MKLLVFFAGFEEDSKGHSADMDMVMQVCQRMEIPGIAVCENFSRIAESFYDVWNRQFMRGLQPEKGYPTYRARVSVGASSDQKLVHPLFKFVLEVPHDISQTELALRNRTEKYLLDVHQILERRLEDIQDLRIKEQDVREAVEATENWADKLGGRLTFCGFIANNTIPSIMLHFMGSLESGGHGCLSALLQQTLADAISSDDPVDGNRVFPAEDDAVPHTDRKLLEAMLKLHLAQTCLSIQAVQDCLSHTPDPYLGHLTFRIQEHVSWAKFMKTMLRRGAGGKVVIYTELCDTVCLAERMKNFMESMVRPVDPDIQIGVLDMSMIQRRQQCKERIKSFFIGGNDNTDGEGSEGSCAAANPDILHILVILVNAHARYFQHSQLAYVREEIDRHMEHHGRNVIVFCMVFPASSHQRFGSASTLLRAGSCAALWLNRWDFHYMEPPCYDCSTDEENQEVEKLQSTYLHHGVQIWPLAESPVRQCLCPNSMLEASVRDQLERLTVSHAFCPFFIRPSAEVKRILTEAGFHCGPTPHQMSLASNVQQRRLLISKLLEWRGGAIKKRLKEQIGRLLADQGVRRQLERICQATDFRTSRTSLSRKLYDAVLIHVDDICRSFLQKFVASLPLEFLLPSDHGDIMEEALLAAIDWLGARKLAHPTDRTISLNFSRIPFFSDVDSLLSKLVGGPHLAQQESEGDRLVTDSALQASWRETENSVCELGRSQANFAHLLSLLSHEDLLSKFCQDALASMIYGSNGQCKWSLETQNFANSLLVETAKRFASRPDTRPLFIYWFLRRHSSMLLDIISISEMLPKKIQQDLGTNQTIGLDLLTTVLEQMLFHLKMKPEGMDGGEQGKTCLGAMGSLAVLFSGLLETDFPRSEDARGSLCKLSIAFLKTTFVHLTFQHVATKPEHIRECIKIVNTHCCQRFQPQDANSLVDLVSRASERLSIQFLFNLFDPHRVLVVSEFL